MSLASLDPAPRHSSDSKNDLIVAVHQELTSGKPISRDQKRKKFYRSTGKVKLIPQNQIEWKRKATRCPSPEKTLMAPALFQVPLRTTPCQKARVPFHPSCHVLEGSQTPITGLQQPHAYLRVLLGGSAAGAVHPRFGLGPGGPNSVVPRSFRQGY